MQATERMEFVRVLNGMAAMKRVDLTSEAIELWWQAMSRWSIADFKSAASHLVRSHEWMPSPFHFEQIRRAGEPTPAEAWLNVLSGQQLLPGSREARAAAVLGGQQQIRMANIEKDLPFLARRFKDAYEELTDVDSVREELPQITSDRALEVRTRLLRVMK